MACDFTAANTQYLLANSAVLNQVPLTLACWAYPNTTATMSAVSIITSSGSERFQLVLNSQQVRAGAIGSATAIAQTTGTFATQQWFHAAGVFESNASRIAYRDGGNIGTNTTSSTLTGLSQTAIGAIRNLGSISSVFDGRLAEVGIWNAALTAEEIASLADGMTCDKIRPQSLVFYAPLVRDLIDIKGGLTITNNNSATVANHPRVYS